MGLGQATQSPLKMDLHGGSAEVYLGMYLGMDFRRRGTVSEMYSAEVCIVNLGEHLARWFAEVYLGMDFRRRGTVGEHLAR